MLRSGGLSTSDDADRGDGAAHRRGRSTARGGTEWHGTAALVRLGCWPRRSPLAVLARLRGEPVVTLRIFIDGERCPHAVVVCGFEGAAQAGTAKLGAGRGGLGWFNFSF
ncbi:atherin-like [Iris pallida]|uniref:Atherin-like n=1 Tax=Iris pallida TaxID=29817 RepID=A0AAX6GKM5_IRIPA|nr:atherin-like [Iris pallida]